MTKYLKYFFYPTLVTYSYPLKKETVINKIDSILSKKVSFLSEPDITGKFLSSDTFRLETINPASIFGVKSDPTLHGQIFESQNGSTIIKTKTRPPFRLYGLFFMMLLSGLAYLYKFIQTSSLEFLFWAIGILLLGGFLSIGLSSVAIASIQSRYKMYIDKELNS